MQSQHRETVRGRRSVSQENFRVATQPPACEPSDQNDGCRGVYQLVMKDAAGKTTTEVDKLLKSGKSSPMANGSVLSTTSAGMLRHCEETRNGYDLHVADLQSLDRRSTDLLYSRFRFRLICGKSDAFLRSEEPYAASKHISRLLQRREKECS